MEIRTITVDKVTAVVRSHFRRTPIIEKEYLKMIRQRYPEIEPCERAMLAIPYPANPKDQEAMGRYESALIPIVSEHDLGWELKQQMDLFAPLAARLKTISGASFSMASNERFEEGELVKAFEDYLAEDGEGLWTKVREAIAEIDKPATPVEQRPQEALTAEEQADPLSEKRTRRGTKESANISTT